ncbi:uncharacterized protein LOC131888043 [Tigriopus californicus]|uniref:uncharacterized protein LOC131888043 n=1 Tax=Tigriopus californicus TaxID=6832 RepID=UPI0027DA2C2B|nr:uncharacterized protein LOC131888043 [Tigriopus californicus]
MASLLTRGWLTASRSLFLPSSRSQMPLSTSSLWLKRVDTTQLKEDSQIQYITLKNERQLMKLVELKAMAADDQKRQMYLVTEKGKVSQVPTFRLMNDNEAEAAVRKARHHRNNLRFEPVNLEADPEVEAPHIRLKEKVIKMGDSIADHDFEVKLNKIRAWLAKHYFVVVQISGSKAKSHELAKRIREGCQDVMAEYPGAENRLIVQ